MRLAEQFTFKLKKNINARTIKYILDSKKIIEEMVNKGFGELYRRPIIKFEILDEKLNTYIRDLEKKVGS